MQREGATTNNRIDRAGGNRQACGAARKTNTGDSATSRAGSTDSYAAVTINDSNPRPTLNVCHIVGAISLTNKKLPRGWRRGGASTAIGDIQRATKLNVANRRNRRRQARGASRKGINPLHRG